MTADEIKSLVIDYAYGIGISPAIALAQIERESNFNPNANGASGEKGIAQFMPATWKRFGEGPHSNAYDPIKAMDAWFNYMQFLLNLFDWDIEKALIGYNGGEGHLTNPDRYGPPSEAAKRYAREIMAKASQSGDVFATGNGQAPISQPDLAESQVMTYILIGAAALLAAILLSRN